MITAFFRIRATNAEVRAFKTICTTNRSLVPNILQRFKMNLAFMIAEKTYPYILINLVDLVNDENNRLFQMLFNQAKIIQERDGLYVYFFYYLSSTQRSFNDQRMYYYEQNNDRFQQVIEFPVITHTQITFLENVAYYTQAFNGDYFGLYRIGKLLTTPLNEIRPFRWYQLFGTNFITQSATYNAGVLFQPPTSTNFVTAPKFTLNNINSRVSTARLVVTGNNIVSLVNYLFRFTSGLQISPGTHAGESTDIVSFNQGTTLNPVKPLYDFINNSTIISNACNSVFFNNTPVTISSINQLLTDILTWFAALGNDFGYTFPSNSTLFTPQCFPALFPVAIMSAANVSTNLEFKGFTTSFTQDSNTIYKQYLVDPRCQDNFYDNTLLSQMFTGISSFKDAATVVRVGNGNIMSDVIRPEVVRNWVRQEVYIFDLSKFSPFVKLRITGVFPTKGTGKGGGGDDEMSQYIYVLYSQTGPVPLILGTGTSSLAYSQDNQNYPLVTQPFVPNNAIMERTKRLNTRLEFSGNRCYVNNYLTKLQPSFTPFNGLFYRTIMPMAKIVWNNENFNEFPPDNFTLTSLVTLADQTLVQRVYGLIFTVPDNGFDLVSISGMYNQHLYGNDALRPPPGDSTTNGVVVSFQCWQSTQITFPYNFTSIGVSARDTAAFPFGNPVSGYSASSRLNFTTGQAPKNRTYFLAVLVPSFMGYDDVRLPIVITVTDTYDTTTYGFNATSGGVQVFNVKTNMDANISNQNIFSNEGVGPSTCFSFGKTITSGRHNNIFYNWCCPTRAGLTVFQQVNQVNFRGGVIVTNNENVFSFNNTITTNSITNPPLDGTIRRYQLNMNNNPQAYNAGFGTVTKRTGLPEASPQLRVEIEDISEQEQKNFWDFELPTFTKPLTVPIDNNFYTSGLVGYNSAREDFFVDVDPQFGPYIGGAAANSNIGVMPWDIGTDVTDIYEWNLYTEQIPNTLYANMNNIGNFQYIQVALDTSGGTVSQYPRFVNSTTLNHYRMKTLRIIATSLYYTISDRNGDVGSAYYTLSFNPVVSQFPTDVERFIFSGIQHGNRPIYSANNTRVSFLRKRNSSGIFVKQFQNWKTLAAFTPDPGPNVNKVTAEIKNGWINFINTLATYGPLAYFKCSPVTIDNPLGTAQYTSQVFVYGFTQGIRTLLYQTPVRPVGTLIGDLIYTIVTANVNTAVLFDNIYVELCINGLQQPNIWPVQYNFTVQPEPTFTLRAPTPIIPSQAYAGTQTIYRNTSYTILKNIPGFPFNINLTREPATENFTVLVLVIDFNDENPNVPNTFKVISRDESPWPTNEAQYYYDVPEPSFSSLFGVIVVAENLSFPILDHKVYFNSTYIALNPRNTIFSFDTTPTYIPTPLTGPEMNYWGDILFRNPNSIKMYIELDLALFLGNRDYIWQQFSEFTAMASKEGDLGNVSNMMVLTDNAENYGFQSSYYTILYNTLDGNERFFWNKWMKKTNALFLINFAPMKLQDFDVWDFKLKRYLTLFFR